MRKFMFEASPFILGLFLAKIGLGIVPIILIMIMYFLVLVPFLMIRTLLKPSPIADVLEVNAKEPLTKEAKEYLKRASIDPESPEYLSKFMPKN